MIGPYWRILVVGLAAALIAGGSSYVLEDVLALTPHTVPYTLAKFGIMIVLIMPLLVWAQRSFSNKENPPPP